MGQFGQDLVSLLKFYGVYAIFAAIAALPTHRGYSGDLVYNRTPFWAGFLILMAIPLAILTLFTVVEILNSILEWFEEKVGMNRFRFWREGQGTYPDDLD